MARYFTRRRAQDTPASEDDFYETMPVQQQLIHEAPYTEVRPVDHITPLVYAVLGIVEALLVMRFVLELVSASPINAFVNFIYNVTAPLVTPFIGSIAVASTNVPGLSIPTLIAIIVYLIAGFLLMAIIDAIRGYYTRY